MAGRLEGGLVPVKSMTHVSEQKTLPLDLLFVPFDMLACFRFFFSFRNAPSHPSRRLLACH
jgi:hypothetical protein